jgi:hypothetical protein
MIQKAPTQKWMLVNDITSSIDEIIKDDNKTIAKVTKEVKDIAKGLKTLYQFDMAIPPSTYEGKNQEETQYLLQHKPILLPSSYEKMTTIFGLCKLVFLALPMFVCVTIVLLLIYVFARFHPVISEGWENFMEDHFVKGISVLALLIAAYFLWIYIPWIESHMISLSF